MKDLICDEFQNTVGDLLIRHHSLIDVLSKLAESNSRVNRSVIKDVLFFCRATVVKMNHPAEKKPP